MTNETLRKIGRVNAVFVFPEAYILFLFAETKIFPYDSFIRSAITYLILVVAFSVASFGLTTVIVEGYHRVAGISSQKNCVKKRAEISCKICDPIGYQIRYNEEQRKKQEREAHKKGVYNN